MLVDPAFGWKYGFPKVYNPEPGEGLEEFLVRHGYPPEDAEAVASGKLWCRFIGQAGETREDLLKAAT